MRAPDGRYRLYVKLSEAAWLAAMRRGLQAGRSTRDQIAYDLERLYDEISDDAIARAIDITHTDSISG